MCQQRALKDRACRAFFGRRRRLRPRVPGDRAAAPLKNAASTRLKRLNLTPYAIAKAVGVPRTRIERLAREETPVTADTALRLARYFGTMPGFWMGIQAQYDLERAEDELATGLNRIEPLRA
jgi:antitoxin HigA-1